MNRIHQLVLSRWTLSLTGTAVLAGMVWVFGPILAALEDPGARLAIAGMLFVIWGGGNLARDWRARRRERTLSKGLIAVSPEAGQAISEQATALAEKLAAALALLRRARGTRGYLYEQPWYVIIGPPGAGKTTALLNAGLEFPLAKEMGQGPLAGIGGTRLCEWWFTGKAVLIDTAGRYTLQDSDAAVDRAGWDAFLELLKRTRPRQPLNGVIAAIAVSDLVQATPAERQSHANAIRQRLRELQTRLAARLPVYVLFTKTDLLAGFTEFFDDLTSDGREQVWGATFPLLSGPLLSSGAATEFDASAAFSAELRLLTERLGARMWARLGAERDMARRMAIAGFPGQFASLEQPVSAFLHDAFAGSPGDPAPLLRGVYFTSGTQEGTPIDRLTGVLARSFGLDQRPLPVPRPVRGRSYFLKRLLDDVILGEAMLVSEPPGTAGRRLALRAASFGAVGVLAIAAALLLFEARQDGQRQIDETVAALTRFEQTVQGLPLDPIADSDLPRLVRALDAARSLPFGLESSPQQSRFPGSWIPGSWRPGLGLGQRDKLGAGARALYRQGLRYALLPRLMWRLEAQMRDSLNRPEFLYEATRVYLMLGGEGPLDPGLVGEWMALDWQTTYADAARAPIVPSLRGHLDALLLEPLPPVSLDGDLVAQARATFGGVPVAQRVYSRIRPSSAAMRLPVWTPAEALGAAGQVLFARASGKPLTEGIAGFLSAEGFHTVLLPSLPDAVKEVAAESWVLGKRAEIDLTGPQTQTIGQAVIGLYEADFIQAWDAVLSDLNVVPIKSLTQAAQDLYILASPRSPMRDLLNSVTVRVDLTPPSSVANAAGNAPANTPPFAAARLRSMFEPATSKPAQSLAGQAVIDHFRPLRDLMGGQLDQALKVLGDLQQQLAKMAAVPIGAAPPAWPAGNDPALALRVEAERQPPPLSRWLGGIATTGAALRGGNARQQVTVAFNAPGGPGKLCPGAIAGRFPFAPTATADIPLSDFGRLFAPGGLLDGFFKTQLRPFVDTSAKIWAPQQSDGVSAPVSAADAAQFQTASMIRDLFFAGGGTTPTLSFEITPVGMDAGTTEVTLELDGTAFTFPRGQNRATPVVWPGSANPQAARLVFQPPPAGQPGSRSESGAWALFRLFAQGAPKPSGPPSTWRLTFQMAERQAIFDLRFRSVHNPLANGLLQQFRCPSVQ